MKSRSVKVHGVVLFFCSHFRVYMMPGRCAEEKRVGRGEISTEHRSRPKARHRVDPPDHVTEAEALDLAAVVEQRGACLRCPGVCKRSMADKRRGSLS